MPTTRLTVQRGRPRLHQVTVTAGSAEAQTETMSLNIDFTTMRQGECLQMLDALKQRIQGSRTWPPA